MIKRTDKGFIKLNELEAMYILLLHNHGLSKREIAEKFKYNYMDVHNVIRGNTFSSVTGILNRKISKLEYTVCTFLLAQGYPYMKVAEITNIEANKVRNVKGVNLFREVMGEEIYNG